MLNQCNFIGRLSKEVEMKVTPTGKSVANFSLAVQRDIPNASNERETDFLNFVIWGKPAENMANQLSKGDLIRVTSRVQVRSYEKDGKRSYVTEFVVDGFPEFLRVKKWENGGQGGTSQNHTPSTNQSSYSSAQNHDPFSNNGGYPEVSDDELPF
ncbi:single-stranded DNA-binding protein [Psychrobacillus sp. FSL H8-0487]|uniref:single-stranded DNA-binding protein n=1 Tax=Psychrobacillus sp. FSL H8-0487 TaxID=2921391 RepID=UPI0030FCA178